MLSDKEKESLRLERNIEYTNKDIANCKKQIIKLTAKLKQLKRKQDDAKC